MESPVVHICGGKGTCGFTAGSRAVLHIQRWRLRNPLTVREPWFERPIDPPPGPMEPMSAGHGGMEDEHGMQAPVDTGVPEERALLHRFEQMRDGMGAGAEPPEREQGRVEVQHALLEEEAAGKRKSAEPSGANQILAERVMAVASQGGEHSGKAQRGRKRSRRSSSSGSESMTLVDRHGVSQLSKVSERHPGYLAGETLKKMREYLSIREEGVSQASSDRWRPIVTSYLSTVLLPSTEVSLRNSRELLTTLIARSSDCLLRGEVGRALDILLQRLQAIETSQVEASWASAKHLELVPETKVSCVPPRARRAALTAEKSDLKLKSMLGNPHGPGKTTPGY
eukprot:4570051-Amphidinium_carterae.2